MKQSFYLVFLQFFAIIISVISTLYIANELPSSLYAIIGVQAIVSSIMVVFSNTGVETIGLRNFLYWQKTNNLKKIQLMSSISFFLRLLFSLLIGFILISYVIYISHNKFDDKYLSFFLLFIVSSIFLAINDSLILLLKAHNKYLQAIFSSYFVSIFGRLIALILFVYFGLNYYLYTIIFLPVLVFFYMFYISRSNIKIKYMFSFSLVKSVLKSSKSFALSAYFSFLTNNVDQLLVSLLMPIEVLGVFSFVKRILEIFKSFIANFFDPILQNTVRYKGSFDEFKKYMKKVNMWRNISIFAMFLVLSIFVIIGKQIISNTGLVKYPFFYENLVFVLISLIIFTSFKVNYYLFATFVKPILFLKFTIIVSVYSLFSFSLFSLLISNSYIYSYLIFANIGILIITNYMIKKEGELKELVNKVTY